MKSDEDIRLGLLERIRTLEREVAAMKKVADLMLAWREEIGFDGAAKWPSNILAALREYEAARSSEQGSE